MTETLERQLINLSPGAHVCPIYATTEEQMGALVPFLRAGITRGEQCLYLGDTASIDTVVQLLRSEGIDVQAEIDRRALLLVTERAGYTSDGHFDPQAMYALLRSAAADASASGFAGLTIAGEMTWIAGPDIEDARYLQCEARLNELPPELGTKIVCQYDRRRFASRILRDVLRVHPLVIVGEHVHENAYFDPYALIPGSEDVEVARVDAMLEHVQARTRRQTAIADLGRLSLAGARPAELMSVAVDLIASELNVEFAEVLVLVAHDDSVQLVAGAGWQPSARAASVVMEMDPLGKSVLDAGLPVIVPDWRVETQFQQPPQLRSAGVVSSLQVGIRARTGERLLGVLGVHSSNQRVFAEDEVVLLDTVSTQLAHACRVSRLEAEFRALVEDASDVIARLDHELRYVHVNRAAEGVLGVTADSLIGKSILETGIPEPLARDWELILRRAWQTGREQTGEFSLTTGSGERHFRSRAVPGLGPDGSVDFLVNVWRDVTEQQHLETERTEFYRDLRAGQRQLLELVSGFVNDRERELKRVVDVVHRERLTVRDRNVLQLVAEGWTNREIGARLGLTPGTVKNHVAAILSKLDVTDRTQAAVRAVELGLVGRPRSEAPSEAVITT